MKRNVTQTAPRFIPETEPDPSFEAPESASSAAETRAKTIQHLWLLWNRRKSLLRAAVIGLSVGLVAAFVIPKRYESTAELMPPDSHSGSGMAMLAALNARGGGIGGLSAMAGDLFGLNSTGALFIGIVNSRTVQDRIIDRFNLRQVYGCSYEYQARKHLSENTRVSEDRLSGIITITVSDHDAKRAAAMANAYVDELNRLVVDLATSSAHRERVFLEERLKAVKQDLDTASKQFSEFSSKNTTIDIKEQGKAMIDAAATLTGQLIAAESELRGLEQIYTPENVRVRSVQARVTELRSQLEKLGGTNSDSTNAAILDSSDQNNNSLYPSLRKLPLLGVTYTDLYRQTRIEETVFETLTQEYELAKVQEAKETPSVKVLDLPMVAEHKAFPPRLPIVLLCGFLAFSGMGIWILLEARWQEIETLNPGKALAREVVGTVRARLPWSANGSHHGVMQWARSRFTSHHPHDNSSPEDKAHKE